MNPALLIGWAAAWTALAAGPLRAWALRYVTARARGRRLRGGLLSPIASVAVTGTTAVLGALMAARAGEAARGVVGVPVLALLALADGVAHILPNRLLAGTVGWLALCGAAATLAHPASAHRAAVALVSAALVGALATAVACAPRGMGLGMGDAKLLAVLALWLGWDGAAAVGTALILGVLVGGLEALAVLITGRAGRRDTIALGPALAVGAALAWAAQLSSSGIAG